MPWWTRVFGKILEVTIYGISFDSAGLIACALDIFDESKSSWFRISPSAYGTNDAPADANRNEEVWAAVTIPRSNFASSNFPAALPLLSLLFYETCQPFW